MDVIVCVLALFLFIFGEYEISEAILNDVKGPLLKTTEPEFSRHILVEPVIYKNTGKLVSTFTQGGHIDDIAIQFEGFSKNFILDLKRNRNLFSKSYIEKSFSSKGEYIHRPAKHKEAHCFYHGHIRDFRHSMVAISTCDGISGYIYDGRESYHIEPAYDISSTSHRLYKDSDGLHKNLRCGAHPRGHSNKINETQQILHKNEVLHRMRREVRGPYDLNTNTRFVEMYIVNDYGTYVTNSRNLARQIHITQNIINIVSKLYQPFSIHIALVGIENWTHKNMFTITNEADSTLENFLHYRRSRINPRHPNDNAQLITDTTFAHGVVGKAIKGTICTFQYSGGVNLNLAYPGQTAATIAHELGHNFGMDHDNYTYCQCRDDKCIMAATSGGIRTPTHWSSCSMQALQDAFEMGMDYCLKNKPDKLYGDGPICGNGFTEDDEECDCGLPEVCQNKCCNATTCKLTSGSMCATGLCCDLDTCQPKKAATMCRAPVGECDLPEFCWGDSQYCPEDVFLEDGVECYSGQSYCYKGQCKTHTGQCRLLWGTTGRVSDPVCFKNLNTNGSKHGNCGYNWTTSQYIPCPRDDTMCGLLHCVHQNEKLMFWKDNLAHATPATFLTIGPRTYICRGAMLDVGLDMPDPGMVPDGAKCEDRKICVNHTCTPLSLMGFPTCERGCSQRGVCNSKGHCHCDEGFAPPYCDISGNGGSQDSGPVKITDSNSLLIALLVLFLVVVPLLGIAAFLVFRYRVAILAWWNKHISSLNKQTSRPERPSHPPPKRDQAPPPYPGPPSRPAPISRNVPAKENPPDPKCAQNRGPARAPVPSPAPGNRPRPPPHNGHVAVVISEPVLTGSTHKESQSHIQPSPKPPPKPLTTPALSAAQVKSTTVEVTQEVDPSLKLPTKAEPKSRFGPIFKMPNIGKSHDSPKLPEKKQETTEPEVVKRRELTREISNPVLISTTDRRSKHLVKADNIQMSVIGKDAASQPPPPVPPVPPKVSLIRSESDNTKKNKPLPPRPVSMPVSESGDDTEVDVKDARKSMNLPQRPPPPPVKPNVTNTRETIEQEISKLDQIHVEIPKETKTDQVKQVKSKTTKPGTVNKTPIKKPLQPKTAVKKSSSDSSKKPAAVKKTPATQSKSDPKWTPVDKPIFKPKDKPKKTSHSPAAKTDQSESSETGSLNTRKASTDSLDDDGTTSVYARKKIFEGQKKPLLGAKSTPGNATSTPQTPPKPGGKTVKQIRSVDV